MDVMGSQLRAARAGEAAAAARLRGAEAALIAARRAAAEGAAAHAADLDGARDTLGVLERAMRAVMQREAVMKRESAALRAKLADAAAAAAAAAAARQPTSPPRPQAAAEAAEAAAEAAAPPSPPLPLATPECAVESRCEASPPATPAAPLLRALRRLAAGLCPLRVSLSGEASLSDREQCLSLSGEPPSLRVSLRWRGPRLTLDWEELTA